MPSASSCGPFGAVRSCRMPIDGSPWLPGARWGRPGPAPSGWQGLSAVHQPMMRTIVDFLNTMLGAVPNVGPLCQQEDNKTRRGGEGRIWFITFSAAMSCTPPQTCGRLSMTLQCASPHPHRHLMAGPPRIEAHCWTRRQSGQGRTHHVGHPSTRSPLRW